MCLYKRIPTLSPPYLVLIGKILSSIIRVEFLMYLYQNEFSSLEQIDLYMKKQLTWLDLATITSGYVETEEECSYVDCVLRSALPPGDNYDL